MAEKTNRNLDKDYLNKRAETLQQFMDQLIESETLRSSLQLLSFLKVTDGGTWLKVKEQFDKAIVPTSNISQTYSKKIFEGKHGLKLEDFQNIHDTLECKVSAGMREYTVHLEELTRSSHTLYDRCCFVSF